MYFFNLFLLMQSNLSAQQPLIHRKEYPEKEMYKKMVYFELELFK